MSTVEEELRTLLLTFSGVTDLVGTGSAARIRPDRLQQDDDETSPHVIIEVDSENKLNDLTGKGGRVMADVTIRCRAQEKEDARALSESIRTNDTDPGTGLAGYSGTPGSLAIDAWLEDTATSFLAPDDASDEGYYDVFDSYTVSFAETT